MRVWSEERDVLVSEIRFGSFLWDDNDWVRLQRGGPEYGAAIRCLREGDLPHIDKGLYKHHNKDPYTGDYETGYVASSPACVVVLALKDEGIQRCSATVTCVDHEFPHKIEAHRLTPVPLFDIRSRVYPDEQEAMMDRGIRKLLKKMLNDGISHPPPICYMLDGEVWVQEGDEVVMAYKVRDLGGLMDGTGKPSILVSLKMYEEA